jgi:hypothetical protein
MKTSIGGILNLRMGYPMSISDGREITYVGIWGMCPWCLYGTRVYLSVRWRGVERYAPKFRRYYISTTFRSRTQYKPNLSKVLSQSTHSFQPSDHSGSKDGRPSRLNARPNAPSSAHAGGRERRGSRRDLPRVCR